MSDEIYVAFGIDPDFQGGWNERIRRAFESREDCEEYLEHELHGGRVQPLTLETSEEDDD